MSGFDSSGLFSTYCVTSPVATVTSFATTALFANPSGVAFDGDGDLYVADAGNRAIRKVTPAGEVTTFAGSIGSSGSDDGTGTDARFSYPVGVAFDGDGNLYVTERFNDTIRKVTPAGVVTTFAGSAGNSGTDDGTGTDARFNGPTGVAVDGDGNLYVTDLNNHTIRKVTPAGVVTTFAGSAGLYGSDDGTGTDARFTNPQGVVFDGDGILYVFDNGNHTIRKVTPAGVVTTFAGSGSNGSEDGTGTAASFNYLRGGAFDGDGNLFVADAGNRTIRKVTPAGVVTTFAGSAGSAGSINGIGPAARFSYPVGVAFDGDGNLYVADDGGTKIRKVTPAG
ncbi:MAG TPA: hypothetical protein DCE75_11425 [Acidimicrobiaceae bacterium]|nr:hypothetical protein [Acidimicrobiaceae bacterium]